MKQWWKNKWVVIIAIIILFPIINFYMTPILPERIQIKASELNEIEDDIEFIKAAYEDIGDRFNSKEKCWRDDYFKNYLTSGEKIFELEGECLPCHIQNNLLKAYLIESGRFTSDQLITKTTVCWDVPMFHVYTEVHLDNGTVLNVDQWGKGWGVDFGQTIYDTGVCNK